MPKIRSRSTASLSELNRPFVDKKYAHLIKTLEYVLLISSFNICQRLDEFWSSTFHIPGYDKFKFSVHFHPKENTDYFAISLKIAKKYLTTIHIRVKFIILNIKNVCLYATDPIIAYDCRSGDILRFDKFVKWTDLLNAEKGYVMDETLKVCCRINVIFGNIKNNDHSQKLGNNLSSDFGNLFNCEEFSDVILTVGKNSISAHKALLSARSETFDRMLQKNKGKRLYITDLDFDVLKAMVNFIYTDEAPNIETIARKLYVAAEVYALERLRGLCEKSLCENLSIATAAELLIFADRHNNNNIKRHTLRFICVHAKDVVNTPGFNTLVKTAPFLTAEAYRALVTAPKYL